MGRWDGIDAFIAVCETEGFTSAAARLGVSTSHVSREIARLEDRLQVRLLYRTTRRVSVTDAGKAFLERCRRLAEEREELFAEVSERDGAPRGRLRLTCSVAYGERFIVPLVNRFLLAHPQLSVAVDLTNRLVDVVGEGFDLAVRTGANLNLSRLIAVRLASRARLLCASPAYLATHGAPRDLADLTGHACLIGATDVWRFSRDGGEVDFRPQARWRCNSGFAVLDAARRGLGICQLPDFYVDADLAAGSLVSLLPERRPADEGVWAVYPHRRHLSPKVSLLVAFLKSHIAAAEEGAPDF